MVNQCVDLLRLVRVDDQPRPLVEEHQVLVLIDDVEARLPQREEEVVLLRLGEEFVVDIQLQHVARLQALVALGAGTVHLDALDADILLQQRGRQKRQRFGHKTVQPLPGVVFSDGQFAHRLLRQSFVLSSILFLFPKMSK